MTCDCTAYPKKKIEQIFADKSKHIRVECTNCGKFLSWEKSSKSERSYRQELFNCVRELSYCETREQFLLVKAKACQLILLTVKNGHGVDFFNDEKQLEMPVGKNKNL